MKQPELRKLIREEVKKTLKEVGQFTTALSDEEKNSLFEVVKKIDELKAAIETANKTVKNREIQRLLTVGGLPDVGMLRARMTSIYQLRDL